ncbi:DUF3617 domain-containing protein [Sphingomonas sp.]|uniref:DUF3617 domain-containing protein n=1 Tax=Sphingomonas sp. TaxID=28214 RepID=UPI002FC8EE29
MVRTSMIALALAALAACGSQQPSSQGKTVAQENDVRADAAAQGADPNALLAGRWETKQEMVGVAKAGLEAQSKREIAAASGASVQCLPALSSKRPDANFFAGSSESECKYRSFSMRDGRLDATIVCTATPGSITMTLGGKYTPTSYTLDATAVTSGVPNVMRTSAKITGTWLGACPERP